MPKSKQSVKLKLRDVDDVEITPYSIHGLFAVHNQSTVDGSLSDKYFSITHIPTGYTVFTSCPFKSKASELAKLLSELVDIGLISSSVGSTKPKIAMKAFDAKVVKFLREADRMCSISSKAKEITFQNLFDEMFKKELNSTAKLEQQSLFREK